VGLLSYAARVNRSLALAFLLTAACSNSKPAPSGVALGDATVYELVDRRFQKREPPVVELKLRADGRGEWFNDKTGKPYGAFTVNTNGTLAIATTTTTVPLPALDGDSITLDIDGKPVKVVLGADGNVTVADRPDGVKWRIEAKDPAVARTAFRVLAVTMKQALD
jgi:hypothetical protein